MWMMRLHVSIAGERTPKSDEQVSSGFLSLFRWISQPQSPTSFREEGNVYE
jgi:hypothetical protein